jgi:hypothetical protein
MEHLSDSEPSDEDTLVPLHNSLAVSNMDYADSESVGSSDSEKQSDSEEEWNTIPKPQTWDEQKLQKLEKQQKIVQAALMKSAEHLLDGAVDKRGGAKDKTDKKRGPYGIRGMSDRTAQRKRQKIQKSHAAGMSKATKVKIQCQLDAVTAHTKNPGLKQRMLTSLPEQTWSPWKFHLIPN